MVGKKKYRRQQFQKAERYKKQTETGTRVRMAYWSANGILNNPGKKQRIVEAMEAMEAMEVMEYTVEIQDQIFLPSLDAIRNKP